MENAKDLKVTFYQSLEDISIVLFSKILDEHNYSLLIKDYDKETTYPDQVQLKCADIWSELYDEFFNAKNDGRAKNSLKNKNKTGQLQLRMQLLSECMDRLAYCHNYLIDLPDEYAEVKQSILSLISKIDKDIVIKKFDSIPQILDRLLRVQKSYMNEYGLIEKRVEQTEKKAKKYIHENLVSIQNALGYSIGNFNDISVIEFIFLEKSAINKLKPKQKNG